MLPSTSENSFQIDKFMFGQTQTKEKLLFPILFNDVIQFQVEREKIWTKPEFLSYKTA